MKKYLLFFVLFLFPFLVVFADGTREYKIDAYIKDNGDMYVVEYKELSGEYNGILSTLRYANKSLRAFTGDKEDFNGSLIYNATNLTDLKVYGSSYDDTNEKNWKSFELVNYASKGDYGIYKANNTYEGVDLTIYQPSTYNEASIVTYTLKDVVLIHNDVAEIAWDFISSSYEEEIENLVITIHLPSENSEGNLRVFSHGPLTGYNEIIDNKTVRAYYNNLYGDAIDVRVVFDKSLAPTGTKKSNIDGLESILAVERKRADIANEYREEARNRVKSSNIIGILSILSFIGIGIYVYIKHDKEFKSNFFNKYNREFIEDYNVEVVDYIMNKSISQKAFAASIMNLIYKKYLTVEKIPLKKNKVAYEFVRTTKECNDSCEKYLLDFLITEVGDNTRFTNDMMKKYAESRKTYDKFTRKYNTWKNMVERTGVSENIFLNKGSVKTLLVLLIILIIGINFYSLSTIATTLLPAIVMILGIFLILYVTLFTKRTEKGNEHYVKWLAFKNFLKDFGSFKAKDLPEIILWERYLVYATVFGLAERVQKEMKVKIIELAPESQYDTFGRYLWYNNIYHHINTGVNNSFSAASHTAAVVSAANASSIAGSSNSSSGGFGGGSSFGGGGFGGGGSGGGRF